MTVWASSVEWPPCAQRGALGLRSCASLILGAGSVPPSRGDTRVTEQGQSSQLLGGRAGMQAAEASSCLKGSRRPSHSHSCCGAQCVSFLRTEAGEHWLLLEVGVGGRGLSPLLL